MGRKNGHCGGAILQLQVLEPNGFSLKDQQLLILVDAIQREEENEAKQKNYKR